MKNFDEKTYQEVAIEFNQLFACDLTDWEHRFLTSLSKKNKWSTKQDAVYQKIYKRLIPYQNTGKGTAWVDQLLNKHKK